MGQTFCAIARDPAPGVLAGLVVLAGGGTASGQTLRVGGSASGLVRDPWCSAAPQRFVKIASPKQAARGLGAKGSCQECGYGGAIHANEFNLLRAIDPGVSTQAR